RCQPLGIGTCQPQADDNSQLTANKCFTSIDSLGNPRALTRGRRQDSQMLRVTVQDTAKTWRLKLEGKLAGEAVVEAERAWMDAPAAKSIEVDLRAVSCADPAGQRLLSRMHRRGATLVAQGVAMKAMVSEIRDGRLEAGIVARFVALLVLALLLPARSTFAQVPAATPLRLTLQQAVTLGLKQAPEIAIANLTLAESQQARTAA